MHTSMLCEEFQAVAVEGQVASGDHDASIVHVASGDAGEEHGWSGREATVG
jgi:hypothetical protein